jgi:hypothetical protein
MATINRSERHQGASNGKGAGTEVLIDVNNDGAAAIHAPYSVRIRLRGTADYLSHRWSNEAVAEKAAAAKNSAAKKADNIESYVYRNDAGQLCIPGRGLQRAIVEAGRYRQDPRSPRKSAMDLVKAGVFVEQTLLPVLIGGEPITEWSYLDRQRVVVQRSAITRERPAYLAGWEIEATLVSVLPEYVDERFLRQLVDDAGRLIGIGDFRPSYGRFVVVGWSMALDPDPVE